jgi:primosomal protein N'
MIADAVTVQLVPDFIAHPEFPDKELAQIVAATQQCFNDKLAMWHGTLTTPEQREQILREVLTP